MKLIHFVLFAILLPASVFADQIILKNGDRLTGAIVKTDTKNLVIKTEFAGEVTVQWVITDRRPVPGLVGRGAEVATNRG